METDIKTIAENLKQTALNNPNGFTADIKTGLKLDIKEGFAVATTNNFSCEIDTAIKNLLIDYESQQKTDGVNFGGWNNNGLFYCDYSFITTDKKEAVLMGFKHNQKAIFDFEMCADISLSDYDALVLGITELLNRRRSTDKQNVKTEFAFFLEGFNKLNIGITTKFLKSFVVGNNQHKGNRINYILHKAGYSDLKNMPYGNHYHSHLKNGKIERYKEMLKVVKPITAGA